MTGWTNTIGWTLLHFVWEGTVIAVLTAVLLRVLRRASPHARYVAGCAGLLATLAAPLVTGLLLSRVTFTGAVSTRIAATGSIHGAADYAPAVAAQVIFAPGAALAIGDQAVGRALSA